MTTYEDQFNSSWALFSSKQSAGVADTNDYGRRSPTLDDGMWTTDANGRHFITSTSASNPINLLYRIEDMWDLVAQIHHLLSYFNYLTHWPAITASYQINSVGFHNFATFLPHNVVSASGNVLTLSKGGANPTDRVIATSGVRGVHETAISYTDANGTLPQPGDMVSFGTKSVLGNRIEAQVHSISIDDSTTGNFTVTVDQSVAYANTFVDPDATGSASVTIHRNAVLEPEDWRRLDPLHSFFGKEVVQTIATADAAWDTGADKITILSAGSDIGIAVPFADRQPEPSGRVPSNIYGTFKFEYLDTDLTTWVNITTAFRVDKGTYWQWPDVICTHKGASDLQSYITNVSNYIPAGVETVRITTVQEDTDVTTEGVHSPCIDRCNNSKLDHTGQVGSISTNGVGTESGRHYYCNARATTPAANLDVYRPRCYQFDCPNFRPGERPGINEETWAQILNGMGEAVKQETAGRSNNGNKKHFNISTPSIYWLMNEPDTYWTEYGSYIPQVAYESGGFYFYDGIATDGSGNQSLKYITGADFAQAGPSVDFTSLDYDTNRAPADHYGILRRRVTGFAPNLQSYRTDSPTNGTDPSGLDRSWLGCRQVPPVTRGANAYQAYLDQNNRSKAGIEGENRIQRFNRGWKRELTGITITSTTKTPEKKADYYQAYSTTKTIGQHDNIKAELRIRRDGAVELGNKRIGGLGVNGKVYQVESLGGSVYRLHCYLGRYLSHTQGSEGDTVAEFYASGNVVDLPFPYRMNASMHNYKGNLSLGGPRRKASIGDVVSFPSLGADYQFTIKYAEAGAGNSMSAVNVTDAADSGIVGPFFDFGSDLTTGSEVITIEKLEIQLISSTYQVWPNAINQTLYEDRPKDNSQTAIQSNIWLDQDVYNGILSIGAPVTITSIVNDGGANNPPRITALDHGLEDGDRIFITGSNSTPNIDGYYNIIWIDKDTIVLSTAEFQNNPIQVPGTLGTIYNINEDLVSRGTYNAYPSWACFHFAWATTHLDGMRITYRVDGAASTTATINITPVKLVLSQTPDTSTITSWKVYYRDRRTDPDEWTLLTYQGTITDEEDITIYDTFTGWWYKAATIYFHPNMTGAEVLAEYVTTGSVSMGDNPIGVAVIKTTGSSTYQKRCDILDVIDEMGLIASDTTALENVNFRVNTDGVFLNTDMEGITPKLGHRDNTIGGAYSQLTEGNDFHVHESRGLYYITQAGYDQLAAVSDFEIQNWIANVAHELPVENLRSVVKCLDALDMVIIGNVTSGTHDFGIESNLSGFGGSTNKDDPNNPGTNIATAPIIVGNSKSVIESWNSSGTPTVNGTVPAGTDASDLFYEDFIVTGRSPTAGTDLEAGAGFLVANEFTQYYLAGSVKLLNWAGIMRRLPADSTIVDAKMEVTLGSGTEFRWRIDYASYAESGLTGSAGTDPAYTAPASSNGTETEFKITWLFLGQTNDGYWHSLGSADDVNTINARDGLTTVIDCKSFIEMMLSAKESRFKQVGIAPAATGAGLSEEVVASTGDLEKGIINALRAGFHEIKIDHEYDDPNGYTRFYFHQNSHEFIIKSFTIGNLMIQFNLSTSVVGRRLTYGNWPIMSNIT